MFKFSIGDHYLQMEIIEFNSSAIKVSIDYDFWKNVLNCWKLHCIGFIIV